MSDPAFEAIGKLFRPLTLVRGYLYTRRLIKSDPTLKTLHRASDDRVMGPWEYNLTETALAGIPAAILTYLSKFIASNTELLPNTNNVVLSIGEQVGTDVFALLASLTVPISFTLTAFGLAFCSLWIRDYSRAKFKSTLQAWLYFDGTYGLVAQSATQVILSGSVLSFMMFNSLPGFVGSIAMFAAGLATFAAFYRVADDTFRFNGYTAAAGEEWVNAPDRRPPWGRYVVASLIFIPVALVVWVAFCSYSSLAVTWLVDSVLSRF